MLNLGMHPSKPLLAAARSMGSPSVGSGMHTASTLVHNYIYVYIYIPGPTYWMASINHYSSAPSHVNP